MKHCLICKTILLNLILSFVINQQRFSKANPEVSIDEENTTEQVDTNLEWDYEPRVWSPDDEDDARGEHDLEPQEEYGTDNSQANGLKPNEGPAIDSIKFKNKMREKSYFFNGSHRRLKVKQSKQDAAEKCDQYWVDVKETVVCDNNRCDKFDFDWPQHDNQLVLIQSTKFGMRFHRSDFAFAESPTSDRKNQNFIRVRKPSSRIKFDIFELFKPKPTSTVSPVTSLTPATTTTESSTSEQPTSKPKQNDSSGLPSTSTIRPSNADITSQDNNKTRLVTTFRLDTRRRMQTMIGFGGALSDSTCRNIKSLSSSMSKNLMEDYFGPRGLRYNIARMTIGSSDFSTTPYTNNDKVDASTTTSQPAPSLNRLYSNKSPRLLDETDDVEMKRFRLVDEDYEYKLPVARQAIALSRQELKFFSSLWSPPVWMKNNSHIVHGYLKGDIYGPYYKALADYIIKWHESYRKNGIEFWATTGLNEPITGIKPFIFHNSLGITREDYITFIKIYLGPMMRQRGFGQLKFIAMDDNKGYAPNLIKALLSDEEAAKYVAGVGVHWYMNDEYENLNFLSTSNYSSRYFLLSTEACNGYLPFQVHTLPGNWDRGVAYMYDIIKLIQKNSAGWVDWNMALNLYGGPTWAGNFLDSPIIVNPERDEYYKSPAYYAIGHFSRFVEPNSTRLDHRLANAKYDYPLEAVAFYTPKDYIVIVVLNANRYEVPFKIIVDRRTINTIGLKEESFNTIVFKARRAG